MKVPKLRQKFPFPRQTRPPRSQSFTEIVFGRDLVCSSFSMKDTITLSVPGAPNAPPRSTCNPPSASDRHAQTRISLGPNASGVHQYCPTYASLACPLATVRRHCSRKHCRQGGPWPLTRAADVPTTFTCCHASRSGSCLSVES